MGSEWQPERLVGADEAAELIGGQFPDLRGTPVQPFAEGWDNTVYLVDGQWVFRFPRREIALPGVRREIAVLPRLAGRLPLPVPVPELIGSPTPDYPWPFWAARLVHGTELAEAGLPDPDRVRVATAVGTFLRALHDPALAAEVGDGLPRDPMGRAEPGVRVGRARERLARVVAHGVWVPDPDVESLLARAEPIGPATDAVLVHGDLHIRHLLVDGDGAAAGVIDWGDLCLADPAVDLSLAYAGFTGPARAALLSAYGRVDAERELRARVLAVDLSAVLADYAAADGRPTLLAEALAGIRRAVGE
ncbi:MAG: aminoglycoside phosphotransferase [Actinobacteria bacterium 13_2_20CM_2_71_6]|nr:MAG: aminoglycoside phosphotransferase [Actinobacteria bacterium 13_2_20CM_2_71_6]